MASTALDFIGVVPILGAVKCIPELVDAARSTSKGIKAINKIDVIADISKQSDKASASAKVLADLARSSIKNLDDLKALVKHPENFADGALNHIFYGNKKGGYHYKGLAGEKGQIVSIVDPPNKYGVYRAGVKINGKTKKEINSFFPDNWTPQQVIDAIEEAYAGVTPKANGIANYTMKSGMIIRLTFKDDLKIASAFPLYVE